MSENMHAPLPASLSTQLTALCYGHVLSLRQIARGAQVSPQTVSNIRLGKGSLRSYLQIMTVLGRRLSITSWQGKLLVPIENTVNEELICPALSYYAQNCLRRGHQIGFEKLELSYRDVTISMLERYLDYIRAHAVLVQVLGPEAAQVA
jgi:transcriptional regulator with XRE-family HTH domain